MALGKRLLFVGLLAAAVPAGAAQPGDLAAECARVDKVYPLLMLAAMMEGDVNCGDPESGEVILCNAGETAEQKAARERRLATRQHQEAAYKVASEACGAWVQAGRKGAAADAARAAVAQARATDGGALPGGAAN